MDIGITPHKLWQAIKNNVKRYTPLGTRNQQERLPEGIHFRHIQQLWKSQMDSNDVGAQNTQPITRGFETMQNLLFTTGSMVRCSEQVLWHLGNESRLTRCKCKSSCNMIID